MSQVHSHLIYETAISPVVKCGVIFYREALLCCASIAAALLRFATVDIVEMQLCVEVVWVNVIAHSHTQTALPLLGSVFAVACHNKEQFL